MKELIIITGMSGAGKSQAMDFFEDRGYIIDSEILEAIRFHTLGEAGVGKIAKLLFVVDALEQSRVYEGVETLRRDIENKSLDEAYILVLKRTIFDMIKKNKIIICSVGIIVGLAIILCSIFLINNNCNFHKGFIDYNIVQVILE